MSINDYIADEEKNEARLAVLEVLLDKELIEHEAAQGIIRKIIAEKNTEGLSEAQLFVFKRDVEPLLNVGCTKEGCGQKIDICHLAEAYESGELYCVDCQLDRDRSKHNSNKND